jgi:hypothetical protein
VWPSKAGSSAGVLGSTCTSGDKGGVTWSRAVPSLDGELALDEELSFVASSGRSLVGAAGWGGLSAPLLLLRHWVAGYRFLDLLLCLFAFVVV